MRSDNTESCRNYNTRLSGNVSNSKYREEIVKIQKQ